MSANNVSIKPLKQQFEELPSYKVCFDTEQTTTSQIVQSRIGQLPNIFFYIAYTNYILLCPNADKTVVENYSFHQKQENGKWFTKTKLYRVKEVLDSKGISLTWLAKQLNKSFSTINGYCSNRIQPGLETLDEIAQILQVDLKDLITDKEERTILK